MAQDTQHPIRHIAPGSARRARARARARSAARAFRPDQPQESLAALGLVLTVHAVPLRLPGRIVYAAWDPLRRCVELFGGGPRGTGAELLAALGHELGHALPAIEARPRELAGGGRIGVGKSVVAEGLADIFADEWLGELGTEGRTRAAAALHALSREQSSLATGRSWTDAEEPAAYLPVNILS